MDADVVIVGSGPAGVSAAFPLLESGCRVLMLDGGTQPLGTRPAGPYLEQRAGDAEQWRWMLGTDFHALRHASAVSPKLRVPAHRHVFEGFAAANRIRTSAFVAAGSLAPGGLSNAWGCGVARLARAELEAFPCPAADMELSYEAVARRIGVSGASADDLADYFGVDAWADAPVALDALQGQLWRRYPQVRGELAARGVRLGRSRVAVLTADRGERLACDLRGTCLWGCERRSLYAATEDLALLRKHPNFAYRPGFIVERIAGAGDAGLPWAEGHVAGAPARASGARLLLAAGTLATTRLVLQAADGPRAVPMQSSPTAAFLLWVPAQLGRPHERSFGLGQLSFTVGLPDGSTGFGSLFSTTGIPVAEFVRHLPLARRAGTDVLAGLLSSCAIGNLFLPGPLCDARLTLQPDGSLLASGEYRAEVAPLLVQARRQLARAFRTLGAWVLPGSFMAGQPGGDIHYAASLPMRALPQPGETNAAGEPHGLPGVHVVDAASLPLLTEKSHTLTLMANADRIGRLLAAQLAASREAGPPAR